MALKIYCLMADWT